MKIIFPDGTSFEDFVEQMRVEDEKKNLRNWINNRYPRGIYHYNTAYALSHPWAIVELSLDEVRYFFQRGFRGYDDRASWNVDCYFSKQIANIIKRFIEKNNGVPFSMFEDDAEIDETGDYSNSEHDKAVERWNGVLTEIYEGFRYHDEHHIDEKGYDPTRLARSFELFQKHYHELWW